MPKSSAISKSHDEKDETMKGGSEMTLDEMAQIVDQAREAEYLCNKLELRKWRAQQPGKAQALVEQLQRHLPADVLHELEAFMCDLWARDCLREALQRHRVTTKLRETLPAERWGEIEQLVKEEVPEAGYCW